MDYEGQKLAELLFYWIILSFGGVGWVIGYFQQDFTIVFKCWLVGVAISVVVSHTIGTFTDSDMYTPILTLPAPVETAVRARLAFLQQTSCEVA